MKCILIDDPGYKKLNMKKTIEILKSNNIDEKYINQLLSMRCGYRRNKVIKIKSKLHSEAY